MMLQFSNYLAYSKDMNLYKNIGELFTFLLDDKRFRTF